nr:MFS transporter [Eubacteriales bacterium]
ALLPRMILSFLAAAMVALGAIEIFSPAATSAVGALFLLGSLAFSLPTSLSNTLCAYYSENSYRIDYGMGSGFGSLSFSFASLGLGYIVSAFGAGAMMLLMLLLIAFEMVLVLRYPRIEQTAAPGAAQVRMRPASRLSIPGFCRRYRFYMLTMLGVTCLAATHTMAENYLINLFERIGGGSENVGTALFLACTTAAPFLLLFERIQKKTGVAILMRLSGVFFVLKALLLIGAASIGAIYMIELLQTFTYCFLYPSLYYFARSRVNAADMAKGQALATALYTLGAAAGNSLGGIVIDALGLNAMLVLAAAIAAAGTVIINLFVSRKDA